MKSIPIVLASSSPRRQDILRELGLSFEVKPSDVDETPEPSWTPEDLVTELALRKASAIAVGVRNCLVIGSDTTIAYDGEILGKPTSSNDAIRMLRMLRGAQHRVLTGVAIVYGAQNRVEVGYATTLIRMRDYSESEIEEYVATGEPLDKAGSYAIQGAGRGLIADIEGDLDTVVGLPKWLVSEFLRRIC